MISIHSDVPPPMGSKVLQLTFEKMAPGDSFFLGEADTAVRAMVYRQMKINKGTFTSRVEGSGIRVWRLT